MFSTAVVVDKRFLVEMSDKSEVIKSLFEDLHHYHVVVDCFPHVFEYWAKLVLIHSNLLMSRFAGNSNLKQLLLSLLKCSLYNGGEFPVIMVRKLLVLGRNFPDQKSASVPQV